MQRLQLAVLLLLIVVLIGSGGKSQAAISFQSSVERLGRVVKNVLGAIGKEAAVRLFMELFNTDNDIQKEFGNPQLKITSSTETVRHWVISSAEKLDKDDMKMLAEAFREIENDKKQVIQADIQGKIEVVHIGDVSQKDIGIVVGPIINPRDVYFPNSSQPGKEGESLQEPPTKSEEGVLLKPDGIKASSWWSGYHPRDAFDHDPRTAWGVSRVDAIGASLIILFRTPKILHTLRLYTPPDTNTYRLTKAILIADDGSRREIMFKGFDEWEDVTFKPLKVTTLKLEIQEMMSGSSGLLHVNEIELIGRD
jgi:hypothetical protein